MSNKKKIGPGADRMAAVARTATAAYGDYTQPPPGWRAATPLEVEQMLRTGELEEEAYYAALDFLIVEDEDAFCRVMECPAFLMVQIRAWKRLNDSERRSFQFLCHWCGQTFTSEDTAMHHIMEEAHMTVPNAPSNRRVWRKMREWGCQPGKSSGEFQKMITREGETIEVRPPQSHSANGQHILKKVYETFGGAEAFWAGPPKKTEEPKKVVAPPAEAEKRDRGHANRCFDILAGQGIAMSADAVAEMAGLTRQQAASACNWLVKKKAARRVKAGVYEAIQSPASHHQVGIDIGVHHDAPTAAPETPPEAAVPPSVVIPGPRPQGSVTVPYGTQEDDVEELVSTALDLIFPAGFRGKHLSAVMAWRNATIELVRAINADV